MAVQNTDLILVQDPNDSKFYKLSIGDLATSTGSGTVTGIIGTSPINSDSNAATPTVSVDEASTSQPGVVASLAQASDVVSTNSSPSTSAVVTADLLQATNAAVAQNSTDITNLDVRLDAIEIDVGTLQTDVTALQTGIDGGVYAS